MQWKTVTCGVLSLIFVVLPGHAQSRTEKPAALLSNAGISAMATCLSCLRPTRARPTPRRVQRSSGILHLHGEPRSITPGEDSSTVSVSVTTSGDTAQIGTGPVGMEGSWRGYLPNWRSSTSSCLSRAAGVNPGGISWRQWSSCSCY